MSEITIPHPLSQVEMEDAEGLYWSQPERIASIALGLGKIAMQFARVERIPRYHEQHRENDAEHSFMLSLVATELAARFYPQYDAGLIAQFSTVHDLVELITDDVPTFTLQNAELAQKEATEHAALETLADYLPTYTYNVLLRYEAQQEPEARFVRLVDKILPVIVDIVGPGSKVMHEDYGIDTTIALDANEARLSAKLRQKFPDQELALLHEARDLLARTFAILFEDAAVHGLENPIGLFSTDLDMH